MATWQKVVKHGTGYSEALAGSGNTFVTNGSTALGSIGGTDFISELAVGQKVSIARDGTTEVKEIATVTDKTNATITTNWGGTTGLCTTHVEPGVEIDVANIGNVLHADASRTSIKRLVVSAEDTTFGEIAVGDAVITADAGDKYYPMHLYGNRSTYGTGLYIQQAGAADALTIYKAGTGFFTTGVDNSADKFSIGYDSSFPFFSVQDVGLTMNTSGVVDIPIGLTIGSGGPTIADIEDNDSLGTSDTKLCTQGNIKAYVDAQVADLSFLTSGGRWYTKYNRWHTFNTTYGPNYYNHNKDTTVTDADPIDSTAGYTMYDSYHPPLIAPYDCTITGWSMHATTTSNQTYEVAVATATPVYGGSSANIAPGDQTLLGSIVSNACTTGKWYAWDPGAFSVDVDEGDFIIPYTRRSTNSTSYTYYMYGNLTVNLQPR